MIEQIGALLLTVAIAGSAAFGLTLALDWLREWYEGDTEGDDEPDHDEREPR